MQKIMFNDRYGLTQAVLEGRKTMTRRIIDIPDDCSVECVEMPDGDRLSHVTKKGCRDVELKNGVILKNSYMPCVPKYKIGETVAVAQSYYEIYEELKRTHGSSSSVTRKFFHRYIQGGRMPVSNKMFVRSDLMLHQIRINDIEVERLQDCSDDDILKEGILRLNDGDPMDGYFFYDRFYNIKSCYNTPRLAFVSLIDKVSGKGTWDTNPWVFAYYFELVNYDKN